MSVFVFFKFTFPPVSKKKSSLEVRFLKFHIYLLPHPAGLTHTRFYLKGFTILRSSMN